MNISKLFVKQILFMCVFQIKIEIGPNIITFDVFNVPQVKMSPNFYIRGAIGTIAEYIGGVDLYSPNSFEFGFSDIVYHGLEVDTISCPSMDFLCNMAAQFDTETSVFPYNKIRVPLFRSKHTQTLIKQT